MGNREQSVSPSASPSDSDSESGDEKSNRLPFVSPKIVTSQSVDESALSRKNKIRKRQRNGKAKKTATSKSATPKFSVSKSVNSAKLKKQRSRSNKLMQTVKVGQTVRLTKDRVGFVRFKGRTKFSIGEWYGVELFDVLSATRHNGTVFGKKYFNCPRNRGLFVRRECILEIVRPQSVKKVLRELEEKQLRRRKERERAQQIDAQKNNKSDLSVLITESPEIDEIDENVRVYQQEIYGRNSAVSSSEDVRIRKEFKRFNRLSAIISLTSPELQRVLDQPELKNKLAMAQLNEEEEQEDSDEEEEESDVESEETDESGECFRELHSNDDFREYEMKWFCAPNAFVSEHQHVFNKGLLITQMNTESEAARALILEFGVQPKRQWYVQQMQGRNIKKYSRQNAEELVAKLNRMGEEELRQGYTVLLKQY